LKKEKFQRTKKSEYTSLNQEWLKKLRKKGGCAMESAQARNKRKNKEKKMARLAEQKIIDDAVKEEAKRKKEEKVRDEKRKVRRLNDEFIRQLLNKPDSSTTNFDEFKHAVTNLRKNLEDSTSKTRSAVFASCYRNNYKSVHAKLSLLPKYTSILQYLFDYHEKRLGVTRITVDELIILAFKKIHFEEDQIAGLL